VTKRFKKQAVLDGLDLNIAAGEFLTLLGLGLRENQTTLNLIGRTFLSARQGNPAARPLWRTRCRLRRGGSLGVSILGALPAMTVFENVA